MIEIGSLAATERQSEVAHLAVVREIERLQKVFDVFDDASCLRRWLRGEVGPAPQLIAVLDLAEYWRQRSGGAFDPAAALLTSRWDAAAERGSPPSAAELEAVVASVGGLRRPCGPAWVPPAVPYSLNAIAKGWIVDRALAAGWAASGLSALVVNAGGDLAYRGDTPLMVGIEDPLCSFDNAPPVVTVELRSGALATSGPARRGWQIDGVRYSHVLDPRTGRPVEHHASVSVRADDAATADVVATVLSVLPVDDALQFVDELDGTACCVISLDGQVRLSARWSDPAS